MPERASQKAKRYCTAREDNASRPSEERAPNGPLNPMVKDDHRQSSASVVAPTPTARVESPTDADIPTEGTAIVEHEGRVYVMTHGAYVTESDGALVVKHRRVEVFRKPLDQVSLLFLQGLGTSLSLSLASECAKRAVALKEFRAPFADRFVVALVSRGLKIATPGADGLRLRARCVLARSFIRSWTRKIRWRGRHIAPAGILQHQAGVLVKLINGDAGYRPFRMRW